MMFFKKLQHYLHYGFTLVINLSFSRFDDVDFGDGIALAYSGTNYTNAYNNANDFEAGTYN